MQTITQHRTEEETTAILSGMDKAMKTYIENLNKIAPRCHMTTMFLDGWSDEQWWECRHCGHTKSA
jgi:hypothetical protein